METQAGRQKPSYELQVRVFRRDGWLCHWCRRPVLFPPALKYPERFTEGTAPPEHLAYYHLNNRRDRAPLLDELAAVIDHIQPHATGGGDTKENLVTACNRCNMRKNDR